MIKKATNLQNLLARIDLLHKILNVFKKKYVLRRIIINPATLKLSFPDYYLHH